MKYLPTHIMSIRIEFWSIIILTILMCTGCSLKWRIRDTAFEDYSMQKVKTFTRDSIFLDRFNFPVQDKVCYTIIKRLKDKKVRCGIDKKKVSVKQYLVRVDSVLYYDLHKESDVAYSFRYKTLYRLSAGKEKYFSYTLDSLKSAKIFSFVKGDKSSKDEFFHSKTLTNYVQCDICQGAVIVEPLYGFYSEDAKRFRKNENYYERDTTVKKIRETIIWEARLDSIIKAKGPIHINPIQIRGCNWTYDSIPENKVNSNKNLDPDTSRTKPFSKQK